MNAFLCGREQWVESGPLNTAGLCTKNASYVWLSNTYSYLSDSVTGIIVITGKGFIFKH